MRYEFNTEFNNEKTRVKNTTWHLKALMPLVEHFSQNRKSGNGLTTALLAHNASQIIVVGDSLLSCKPLIAIRSGPHFNVL